MELASSASEDEVDGEKVVERPQLTAKSVLWTLELASNHLFEIDHCMEWSLKLKQDVQAAMSPY